MTKQLNIHWFRQDLRLADNPALNEAVKSGKVLPIYILDDQNAKDFKLGSASRWWLHQSLSKLNESLCGTLRFYKGDAKTIVKELCSRFNITDVYWNRCYEPWRIARDKEIKSQLLTMGVTATSFDGALLFEPWSVTKKDGTPYKIFTPYYRKICSMIHPADPIVPPSPSYVAPTSKDNSLHLRELQLMPDIPWCDSLTPCWQPGEQGAHTATQKFLTNGLQGYKTGRDYPANHHVSRLSPHLHFGEISPIQVLSQTSMVSGDGNLEHFKRELVWREFSYYLLFHWPKLPSKNLNKSFDHFPWQPNSQWLKRWQHGLTGHPFVDAGMRELWQTGFMHNRVRMIAASFLVKNLLQDWRHGAAWFWDCLVDADLASNSASWQWVAGCGTDAAPYFRVFNPTIQGEKFDATGQYTRRFLPELKHLPNQYLFKPWQAPKEVLKKAGIELDLNYPLPIVDLKESRQIALDAFKLSLTR